MFTYHTKKIYLLVALSVGITLSVEQQVSTEPALPNLDQDTVMQQKIYEHNLIEPQYPSYVDQNHYGLCLRAAGNLKKGTIVATANFEQTDKSYIADHPSEEYKYVALMRVTEDGIPTYGKVRGKWAFCNHSCDPNCDVSNTWEIITNRDVAQGQELTTSYDSFVRYLPWPESWNFKCLCQADNCKKIINAYRMDILYPSCKL